MNFNKKYRAVFLDRDGTIIEDRGHISCTEEVVFYPFSFEALKLLQEKFLLFIVTNQSGISLGKVTREEVDTVNRHIVSALKAHAIAIQQVYCCSHTRSDNCECIKPKPCFINKAVEDYRIDITRSYTIGDHPCDVEFGNNAGATGVFVLTGHGSKHAHELPEPVPCFENLEAAARWILTKPQQP